MGSVSTSIPPIPAAAVEVQLSDGSVIIYKIDPNGEIKPLDGSTITLPDDSTIISSYGCDQKGMPRFADSIGNLNIARLCYYPDPQDIMKKKSEMSLPPYILNIFTFAMKYDLIPNIFPVLRECQSYYMFTENLTKRFVSENASCFETAKTSPSRECQWVEQFTPQFLPPEQTVSLDNQTLPKILEGGAFSLSSFKGYTATLLDRNESRALFLIASNDSKPRVLFTVIFEQNSLKEFRFKNMDTGESLERAASDDFYRGVLSLYNFLWKELHIYGKKPRELPEKNNPVSTSEVVKQ